MQITLTTSAFYSQVHNVYIIFHHFSLVNQNIIVLSRGSEIQAKKTPQFVQ